MAKEKIPDSAIGICPICYAKRAIAYTRFSKCVGLIFLFIGQTSRVLKKSLKVADLVC